MDVDGAEEMHEQQEEAPLDSWAVRPVRQEEEPMMYDEVSVIVEGALDEETTWLDETAELEYLRELAAELAGEGVAYEVYRITHDHDVRECWCECVQYLTDHHPLFTDETAAEWLGVAGCTADCELMHTGDEGCQR